MPPVIQVPPPGRKLPPSGFALLNLGFRPFFLLAAVFAVLAISAWMLVYFNQRPFALTTITPSQWHAHEMLYGYGMAVIAGFLLTAVQNWTAVPTIHGKPLLGLVSLWALARIVMLCAPQQIGLAAALDMLFHGGLLAAVAQPIVRARQWRQLGILSKLLLLAAGNLLFYTQATGFSTHGAHAGLMLGLLLIVSLILVISRRVLPMFIERGVPGTAKLPNAAWLDMSIMLGLLALLLNVLSIDDRMLNIALGLWIGLANSVRLARWHTRGLWKVPLLWSLYVGLWVMTIGFLCFSWSAASSAMPLIFAIHCWAIGGIGLVSLGMMARVTLGHTGRNIHQPPRLVSLAFGLMLLALYARVKLPYLLPAHYTLWMALAAVAWMAAFSVFLLIYAPMLMRPRADGLPG